MELPWLDQVKAVLCVYLGGQNVGAAAVKLLYGEENPSGKLAESWPVKLADNPSYLNFPGEDGQVAYHEDIFIGYPSYYGRALAAVEIGNEKCVELKLYSGEDLLTQKCFTIMK